MTPQENPLTGIEAAIEAAGTQTRLADALGVKQQTVSLWLKSGYVPNEHIVAIETMYGVPRSRLINPKIADLVDLPAQKGGEL